MKLRPRRVEENRNLPPQAIYRARTIEHIRLGTTTSRLCDQSNQNNLDKIGNSLFECAKRERICQRSAKLSVKAT